MGSGKVIEIRQEYRYPLASQHLLTVILICNLSIFFFMSICLVSSYWLTAEGFRQGLLYLCIVEVDPMSRARYEPLPFNLDKVELGTGCHPNRDKGYLKFCTFLCLLTQLSSITSAILTSFSMKFKGSKQQSCLNMAICTILVALFCDLLLLYTYQNEFSNELEQSNRNIWELNWAFGLACGCAILALGTIPLLVVAQHRMKISSETEPINI